MADHVLTMLISAGQYQPHVVIDPQPQDVSMAIVPPKHISHNIPFSKAHTTYDIVDINCQDIKWIKGSLLCHDESGCSLHTDM